MLKVFVVMCYTLLYKNMSLKINYFFTGETLKILKPKDDETKLVKNIFYSYVCSVYRLTALFVRVPMLKLRFAIGQLGLI